MKKLCLVAALVLWPSLVWALTYNGHEYIVVGSGADGSWGNAEAAAVAWGGHLVTINDQAEENWLRGAFSRTDRFWIGFTDAAVEGTWVWVSGETPGFTHWDQGEPNESTPPPEGEDFAVLNWASDGAWNDWDHQRPDYSYISGIAERDAVPDGGSAVALLGGALAMLAVLGRKGHR